MGFLTRDVKVSTTTNLENKISAYAIRIMQQRIDKAKEATLQKIKELIVNAIKGSLVYKGLAGDFAGYTNGMDLQAEFGLDEGDAQRALESLVEILEKTCDIYSREEIGAKSKLTININALNPKDYEDELKTGDEFQYISNKKYPIQWMLWLLEASADIVGQTTNGVDEFGITYDLTDKEDQTARSHRALMVEDPERVITKRFGQGKAGNRRGDLSKTANFPYVLPKVCLPSVGNSKNFIEDIAKSREFRYMVTNLIENEVKKILKR